MVLPDHSQLRDVDFYSNYRDAVLSSTVSLSKKNNENVIQQYNDQLFTVEFFKIFLKNCLVIIPEKTKSDEYLLIIENINDSDSRMHFGDSITFYELFEKFSFAFEKIYIPSTDSLADNFNLKSLETYLEHRKNHLTEIGLYAEDYNHLCMRRKTFPKLKVLTIYGSELCVLTTDFSSSFPNIIEVWLSPDTIIDISFLDEYT